LFKPSFRCHRSGVKKISRFWYARIGGRRVPLRVTDRRVAERKALEIERQLELGNDPALLEKARRRPLLEHLVAFADSLRAKGCSAGHIDTIERRLRNLFDGCRVGTLADATATVAEAWLARRQREDGISAQTRRHYASHALQFGRWLVAVGRAARNPFAGLRTNLKVENDRRRRRRALTPEECRRLLQAAAASKRKRGAMTGPHRRLFYLVAMHTGLRRNELGALVPESFCVDGELPTVTVEGTWTKNRKTATLPLRQDLAAELREWLRGKPPGKSVFPVKGRKRRAMLHADLKDAGIEPVVDGKILDIHALRVSFITHLSLSGVPLAVAQKLARHSCPRLTANVYTCPDMEHLHRAVEALPQPGVAADGMNGETPKTSG
jgi:site-specific recombinase XerC